MERHTNESSRGEIGRDESISLVLLNTTGNTVLKQVLKWGPKSTEMRRAEIEENTVDDKVVGDLDVQFGTIETTAEEPETEEPATTKKPTSKAKKAETEQMKEVEDDDDFFGENPFPEEV